MVVHHHRFSGHVTCYDGLLDAVVVHAVVVGRLDAHDVVWVFVHHDCARGGPELQMVLFGVPQHALSTDVEEGQDPNSGIVD